jgi:hypothetical protein
VWTDERLSERFDGIDRSLDRIDRDLRDLRQLMFQLWGTNVLAILVTRGAVIATNS